MPPRRSKVVVYGGQSVVEHDDAADEPGRADAGAPGGGADGGLTDVSLEADFLVRLVP